MQNSTKRGVFIEKSKHFHSSVRSFRGNSSTKQLCEVKIKEEKGGGGEEEEELNPVLALILILICGQGQRPGYTPGAMRAERCWSVWAAKAVIALWGSDLGKWEATLLVAATISYQSSFQTSIGELQAPRPELSYGHCTKHSCL